MAKFREGLEQFLWDEVFGRKETRPKLFTMKDAWRFFMDTASDNPRVHTCALNITPKGDRFEVVQLMLDADGNILKAAKDQFVGRKIVAEEIDESVTQYMDGQTRKIMRLPE